MSKVLIYNLSGSDEAKLKMLCRELNIEARTVEKHEYGYTLGYLLGLSADASAETGEDFDDAMLYIAGIRGGVLNLLLDRLRRRKLIIPLKAIETETNRGFTSYALHRELSAEREAIAKGLRAHP